jgi:hypothetical protein
MKHSLRRKVFTAGLAALLLLLLRGADPALGQQYVPAGASAPIAPQSAQERPGLSPAARFAIRRAHRALEDPACRQIFLDFRDSAGRTLQERLDSLGWSAQRYLDSIRFDDSEEPQLCREGRTLAMTVPGGGVVFLCRSKFSNLIRREPSALWVAVLHEELHSLGLGENPPTSEDISRRVAERCQ